MSKAPGIYNLPAAEYHADPCPEPSLSSSIARELIASSARHAWFKHPRLNANYQPEDDDDRFDLGTALHAYLLEGEAGFRVVDAPDWRTKAAKEARAAARAEGKVALLAHKWADVQGAATSARTHLRDHDAPEPLTGGQPEQTVIWQDGGLWCRARLDWLHDGHRVIDDLKSTEGTANPEVWSRTMFNHGFDLQAAWYLRGLKAVTGRDATFRFIVVETRAPYAVSVIGLGPEALAVAERKVAYALALWRECLARGAWPGYPPRTCYVIPPPWEVARWSVDVPAVIDDGRPLAEQLMEQTGWIR